MRLTLRTLLAYTDDILDPADHEELSKKIEASDFATELIHRTRDTVRRLRLGAPDIDAGGGDGVLDSVSVSDANSVAEYLDNTLPAEDIADFERMCLEPGSEADMHLAEVASCHHVLTMVLGEPAEVDADVRKRMYELPAKLASGASLRVEPAHTAPQPEVAVPASPPVVHTTSPHETEVPDYLREAARAKSRGKRVALAAGLLVAVVGGWFWLNSAEQQSAPSGVEESEYAEALGDLEIGDLDTSFGEPDEGTAEGANEAEPFDSNAAVVESSADEAPAEMTEEVPTETPAAEEAETAVEETVAEPAETEVAEAESEGPSLGAVADPEMPKPTEDLEAETEPEQTVSVEPTTEAPALGVDVDPGSAPAGQDAEMTEAEAPGSEEPVLVAAKTDVETETPSAVEEPTGPVQMGSYLGNNDMLLRFDSEQNQWVRLPPRSAVAMGDRLLALPTFRTHVVLADVNAYLSGGSQLVLPTAEDVAGDTDLNLSLTYGEVLLERGLRW